MYLYINQDMPSVQYLNDSHITLIPVSDNALRFNIKVLKFQKLLVGTNEILYSVGRSKLRV